MKKKICFAGICFIVGVVATLAITKSVRSYQYYMAVSDLKEAEYKYMATKSELIDEVQSYILNVAPTSDLRAAALVDACEKYNVDVKFALAQGEQESHFGTKGLAFKTNSVWNVGAYDGLSFKEIAKNHKYDHPNQSIEPYLKLLTKSYLTIGCEEALLEKYVDKNGKRFATEPTYEERLKSRYRNIENTTKIDSLSQVLHYWTIRAHR